MDWKYVFRVPRIRFRVKTHFYAKKAKFDQVVRVKAKNEISRSRKQNVSEKILVCFKRQKIEQKSKKETK